MAEGLQRIPSTRIPNQWSASWFAQFIREVLAFSDVRNSIEGPGVTISGQPDEPATISATADVLELLEQNYILATPSLFLPNERVLNGQADVIDIVDSGPGNDITVRIINNAIGPAQFRQSTALSVVGRPQDNSGNVNDIVAAANDTLLTRVSDRLDFTQLTVDMAPDALWTYAKIQDATALSVLGRDAGTDGVLNEIVAAADDEFLSRRAGALVFSALSDADIPASIARDSEVAAAIAALNLNSGVYTPTLTNVANLDASTAFQCQYMRVGSVVTVSGKVAVDPTAAALTQLGISLPIASNIGAQEDCAGSAAASGIAGLCAAILGDSTNDRAQLEFIAVDLTNQPLYFSFSYRVLP